MNLKNEKTILSSSFNRIKIVSPIQKFKVGDSVRISKYRELFSKGYTPNWSNEIFTIDKIQLTNPTTYLLKDETGDSMQGGFYEQELQRTKHPHVYLIEKVLRKKGNKILVKWLGHKNSS